jgi:hypothetical protein
MSPQRLSPQAIIRMGFNNQSGKPEPFPENYDPNYLMDLYTQHPEQFTETPEKGRMMPYNHDNLSEEDSYAIQQAWLANLPGNVQDWLLNHLPGQR